MLFFKRMYSLLDLVDHYLDVSYETAKTLITARRMVDGEVNRDPALRQECRRLKREVELLRLALRARGGDPDLIPFMRRSDFFV